MRYGERKTIKPGVRKRVFLDGDFSYQGAVRMSGFPTFYKTFPYLVEAEEWMVRTRIFLNEMKRKGKKVLKIKGEPYVK